jgi:hypothetical protein
MLQKVLKKQVINSTIVLDIFVVTKENIGIVEELKGDESYDGQSST